MKNQDSQYWRLSNTNWPESAESIWATYPCIVGPLSNTIPNLFFGRKPLEAGGLFTILVTIQEFSDDGNPCFVRSISFKKHTIAKVAFKCAHACTNYPRWRIIPFPFPLP